MIPSDLDRPVRSRGRQWRPRSWADDRQPASLSEVVESVRTHLHGPPLTIVLHATPGDRSDAFFEELRPALREEDAVWWVIRGGRRKSDLTDMGLVLDLEDERDSRIYENLIADLVLYAETPTVERAASDEERWPTEAWQSRTSVLVVDVQDRGTRKWVNSGQAIRTRGRVGSGDRGGEAVRYCWDGGATLRPLR